jgi:hypothetical protein
MTEVLQNYIGNGRNGIKDSADSVQFLGSGMVDIGWNQRHLFSVLFAHFLVALSLTFLVISTVCTIFIPSKRGFVHLKMRFFYDISNRYVLWMDTAMKRAFVK